MTTTPTSLDSANSFHVAAVQDRKAAESFRRIAAEYGGTVKSRMLLLAEYHEARARMNSDYAEKFDQVAAGEAVRP
jgi:hypothetical protein